MSMASALHDWWRMRDRRERIMLGTMFAMLAAFVFWYGMLTPLRWLGAEARQHYDLAASATMAIESDLQAIATLRQQRPLVPTGEQFTRTVLAAAEQAQVSISRQRGDETGVLTVGIDAVDAEALFAWLDALRRDHGIAPRSLDIVKRDGRLQVEASFAADGA